MGRKEDEKIAPHCDFIHVHEQVVKQVMDVMPQGDELQQLGGIFPCVRGFHQDPDPLCLKPVGAVRLRHRQPFKYGPVGDLPPAPDPEADASGKIPQGWPERSLFPGRQPHRNNPRPGDGAYRRVEK